MAQRILSRSLHHCKKFAPVVTAAILYALAAGLLPVLWLYQDVDPASDGHYAFMAMRFAVTLNVYVFAGVLVVAVAAKVQAGRAKGAHQVFEFGDHHAHHRVPTWVLYVLRPIFGFGEWLLAVAAAAIALQPDPAVKGNVAVIAILPLVTSIHAVGFHLVRHWRGTDRKNRWQRSAIVAAFAVAIGLLALENQHHGASPISLSVALALLASMFAAANVACMHRLGARGVSRRTDYFVYAVGTEALLLAVGFFTGGVVHPHPWWMMALVVILAAGAKVFFMIAHRSEHDPRVTTAVTVGGSGALTLFAEGIITHEHPSWWAAAAVIVLAITCYCAVVEERQDGRAADQAIESAE